MRGTNEAGKGDREEMTDKGMKLIQFRAQDTHAPDFLAEARRQSLLACEDTKGDRTLHVEVGELGAGRLDEEPDYDWGPKGPTK